MNKRLIHVYPQWESYDGEDREIWSGKMRIVRNRRRIRKLHKRGVPMMDLRSLKSQGYVGARQSAWFVE